ncbi:MAG: metallophosphoesterase [Planctomycetota bacterium]
MKLLCFSDLHCDTEAARKLVDASVDADVLIGAGDFANRHQGLSDTLDVLCKIDKPAVLVPGNGETHQELKAATQHWRSCRVLHGDGCTIDGKQFWGVGGGIPVTPFGDWSYDFDEQQGADLLADCPTSGELILVVHSPPLDTVDFDSNGRVRGSQSVRDAVVRCTPQLVVCGHIHSDWGKEVTLGESRVLNAGPAGRLMELN